MPELVEPVEKSQLNALDEAAAEVFSMMMNVECLPDMNLSLEADETLTAVVGLAGIVSGAFVLRMGKRAALSMAQSLTGTEIESVDSTVMDALGEVCNMLAGAWKSKTPTLASECMLSVPTIVSGKNYNIYTHQSQTHLQRLLAFQGNSFLVTILCDANLP